MKALGKTFSYWEQQSASVVIGVGILLILFIGVVDYLTTADFSLAIFHLLPIAFVSWFAGRRAGIALSLLAALIWWVDDLVVKPHTLFWLVSWNAMINCGFFLITSYLVSTLKLAYEREKRFARADSLTGIVNRRYFLELLQLEIDRSQRHQASFTLAYIDVDDFKAVNDRFGHSTGDRLLCLIAEVIKHQIRSIDLVARLGGDEFAILLPQTNFDQSEVVLHRVHKSLIEAVKQQAFSVGFSVGALTFTQIPLSAEKAIDRADRLMYQVKNSGKNGLEHMAVHE